MEATRTSGRTACNACGYPNLPEAVACSMCGAVLSAPSQPARPTAPGYAAGSRITRAAGAAPFLGTDSTSFPVRVTPAWSPLAVLGLGAVLAPAFLLPLVQYMGWFLASLVHETGHCVFAWLFGHPAFPAIRLDGHAAAVHREQSLILVVLVGLGLVALAWFWRHRPRLRVVMGISLALYPLLALTDAREVLHLVGGHLGELAFAGIFFYRALSGGFSPSVAERVAYAVCAWYLLGRNLVLTFGLMTSEAARAHYAGNGSFGLTNDYIRAGRELGWSLEGVAGLMFLVALTTLPVAVYIWLRVERRRV